MKTTNASPTPESTFSLRKETLKDLTLKSSVRAGYVIPRRYDGSEVTQRKCGTGTYEPTC
jgi:hypothetical protein